MLEGKFSIEICCVVSIFVRQCLEVRGTYCFVTFFTRLYDIGAGFRIQVDSIPQTVCRHIL